MLVEAYHFRRVTDILVGKLGDVYQSVLMDTDIHEGTEVGDIRHDARQFHPFLQVLDGLDIRVELKLLYLFPRVTTRLLQFSHDVSEGGEPCLCRHIVPDINCVTFLLVIDKVDDGAVLILSHLLDDTVALRVDGTVVKGFFARGMRRKPAHC